jgi:hypothetical protein
MIHNTHINAHHAFTILLWNMTPVDRHIFSFQLAQQALSVASLPFGRLSG